MNRKGFMMAEVIVVSAVILVTLVSLYTSYNKLFSLYNQRVNYYDTNTLYELSYIRDNTMYGSKSKDIPKTISQEEFTYSTPANRTLYYIDKDDINSINVSSINTTFKEYINYLKGSINFNKTITINGENYEWANMLIYEKCDNNKKNCTYAYLETDFS